MTLIGRGIVVGYNDGVLRAFDIKSEAKADLERHLGHSSEVLSMDTHSDGKVLLTGGADGAAKLIRITDLADNNRQVKVSHRE